MAKIAFPPIRHPRGQNVPRDRSFKNIPLTPHQTSPLQEFTDTFVPSAGVLFGPARALGKGVQDTMTRLARRDVATMIKEGGRASQFLKDRNLNRRFPAGSFAAETIIRGQGKEAPLGLRVGKRIAAERMGKPGRNAVANSANSILREIRFDAQSMVRPQLLREGTFKQQMKAVGRFEKEGGRVLQRGARGTTVSESIQQIPGLKHLNMTPDEAAKAGRFMKLMDNSNFRRIFGDRPIQ